MPIWNSFPEYVGRADTELSRKTTAHVKTKKQYFWCALSSLNLATGCLAIDTLLSRSRALPTISQVEFNSFQSLLTRLQANLFWCKLTLSEIALFGELFFGDHIHWRFFDFVILFRKLSVLNKTHFDVNWSWLLTWPNYVLGWSCIYLHNRCVYEVLNEWEKTYFYLLHIWHYVPIRQFLSFKK